MCSHLLSLFCFGRQKHHRSSHFSSSRKRLDPTPNNYRQLVRWNQAPELRLATQEESLPYPNSFHFGCCRLVTLRYNTPDKEVKQRCLYIIEERQENKNKKGLSNQEGDNNVSGRVNLPAGPSSCAHYIYIHQQLPLFEVKENKQSSVFGHQFTQHEQECDTSKVVTNTKGTRKQRKQPWNQHRNKTPRALPLSVCCRRY
jgi:hypothetical protein